MTRLAWFLHQGKFLSREEVRRFFQAVQQRAFLAGEKGQKSPVRDYFIIDIALSTGLRVMEIAQLKCGDIFLDGHLPSLLVRNGKGGKRRIVWFNEDFKRHCRKYLLWKQKVGEQIGPDTPLLLSSNTGGYMTTRAIQKAFKRSAALAGLPAHYSIHSLRHTYACELYRVSGYNLRLVQKQLGHASIRTTEVYADVMDSDMQASLKRMYCRSFSRVTKE